MAMDGSRSVNVRKGSWRGPAAMQTSRGMPYGGPRLVNCQAAERDWSASGNEFGKYRYFKRARGGKLSWRGTQLYSQGWRNTFHYTLLTAKAATYYDQSTGLTKPFTANLTINDHADNYEHISDAYMKEIGDYNSGSN